MNCFANNKILSSDWCSRCCLRPPHFPRQLSSPLNAPLIRLRPFSPFLIKKSSPSLAMATLGDLSVKEMPLGVDPTVEEEYASQSKLLREFTDIPIIEKAWIFKSDEDNASQAMFSISQSNLLANKKRTHILSSHILTKSNDSVSFQWAPFPIDITGASAIVPSPSGSKLLVIKNQENESPTLFEIWGPSQLQKEIHVPKSVHGSVFADGWFEGISWDSSETLIAYVAEEPCPAKPAFDDLGYLKEGSTAKKDCGSWKGQGDWEEDWGETYSGKRQPALFVIDVVSGGVHGVKGISKSLSVGQVIWAPTAKSSHRYLVFVGWSLDFGSQKAVRKLGIKYCYNRSRALYAVKVPFAESGVDVQKEKRDSTEDLAAVVKLTEGISSAFFPRFSPDGHSLVFLSARTAVDTGAHWATNSLHRIDWPTDGNPQSAITIADVVPVVMCAEDGCFPGLYCSNFISEPWLSDGQTMIFSSFWRSTQVILSVDVLSGSVARISPGDSLSSWDVLALDGDKILSVSSSPIEPPQIKYGIPSAHTSVQSHLWNWFDVPNPITNSEKVCSLLASLQFSVLKIPIGEAPKNLTKGAKQPYEAIFVSSKSMKTGACDPLVVMLHGGPHSVSLTSFSKSLAFLSSLGYSLLIVNYRGSLGFGEEALQSLPGKIGLQDVNDVLKAIGHVVEMGLADSSKVAVLGGSHGGFLTTHLIGQAPDQFCAAAARNPVCNLELMVGTTDIPDWCYTEVYGSGGKDYFTEAPSSEHLHLFYDKSPISHITKVKTPTIFLLGAQDLRVPVSNGLQYARALKEKGVDVKVIVFPNDVHGISRPQSDFESFLNIGVWFKKYLK